MRAAAAGDSDTEQQPHDRGDNGQVDINQRLQGITEWFWFFSRQVTEEIKKVR